MKLVRVGGHRVLLCRDGHTVRAVQPLCPHYQMPLSDGLLCGKVLQCSWHQSRFDLSTGAVLDPPALSPLATYPVRVADGWVYVTPEPLAQPAPRRNEHTPSIVLLGGGAAGHAAALRLREIGFVGRVVQVIGEPFAPYDRPNLSKEHLSGTVSPGELSLPVAQRVVRVHRRAIGVDPAQRVIRFQDGSSLQYDLLLLATGSVPVKLKVPGEQTHNVLTLRSRADGERLAIAAARARRAVVIGSSFIGMEAAAALRERGLAVTVVTSEATPFGKVLGPELGGSFRKLHEKKGVRFRFRSRVVRFAGRGRVNGVVLSSGEFLPADLCVVGVGVRPVTDGFPPTWCDPAGRVPVDAGLSLPGSDGRIFAAGDIATYPDSTTGQPLHVEHWRVAEQQGRLVAENMLAGLEGRAPAPFRGVPYFWSYQFGQGLDYVGHAAQWDELIVDGDLSTDDFIAYYRQGDRVRAAASVGRSLQMAALLEWMTRHGLPSAEQVRTRPNWVEIIRADG